MADAPPVLGEESVAALKNLVVVLADTKVQLGRRLSDWIVRAPTLESGVACAAIATEELGTARVLYPLLGDLPGPGPIPLVRESDRTRRYSPRFLDEAFPTWSHVVAALVLIDSALNTVLEGCRGSSFGGLAQRADRILDEERHHAAFAEGRLAEAAAHPAELRLLGERVEELLPEMLLWFGPDGEPGVAALNTAGVLRGANEDLRQSWLARVAPALEEAGLGGGLSRDPGGHGWRYPALPWERWNALERRIEDPTTSSR